MKAFPLVSVLLLLCSIAAAAPSDTYNVRKFGAKGDGRHIDSPAINKAIEAAAANGGGTISVPAGTYLCYSIRLKDNIDLHFESGAVLKAAEANGTRGYDIAEPNGSTFQDFGHSHWKNSLIWGIGLHNVSISGHGLIDGTEGLSRFMERSGDVAAANKAIALKECRDVVIRDISMLMCGHFALLLTGVDNLTVKNVTADTNRDAFDIDCCSNVTITDCNVNTLNDDGIVLKSSYALGYAKATENVEIINCRVSGFDPGTMLDGSMGTTVKAAPDRDGPTGRIKIGTESNCGFKHITITDCMFRRCRGLALETVDGAVIEDVKVSNIIMDEIFNSPIYIRLGNRARGPVGLPHSAIRGISISNIVVNDADCRYTSMVFGLEGHMIEDVSISNVLIRYKGGLSMQDVMDQNLSNSFFNKELKKGRKSVYDIPQQEKGYPEPSSHGVLPVYGLFVSHARNVNFRNFIFETAEADSRHAVLLMDVENASFENVTGIRDTVILRQSGAVYDYATELGQ